MQEMDAENTIEDEDGDSTFFKRKIAYKELLDSIENVEDNDFGINALHKIKKVLTRVNQLNDGLDMMKKLSNRGEMLLDGKVVSSASQLLLCCVNNIVITTTVYNPSDFSCKLQTYTKGNEDSYESKHLLNLLSDARDIIGEDTPKCLSIYGIYFPEREIPNEKKREKFVREPEENAMKTSTQRIVEVDTVNDDKINVLYGILRNEYSNANEMPIDYYKFVVDKSSFSNTIENMFYTSFLVRDGKVDLIVDRDTIAIKPLAKHKLREFRKMGGKNAQSIFSMTMADWKDFNFQEGIVEKHTRITS